MSRAGVALLRELTITTGLGTGWSTALLDTYAGFPTYLPGRVLADLAVMIADGGDALAQLATPARSGQTVRFGHQRRRRLAGPGPCR